MIVSFKNFQPPERFDEIPWSVVKIEESLNGATGWTIIDTQNILPVDADPAHPAERNFTTHNGTLVAGWYRVTLLDANGNSQPTEPIYNGPSELMASLDDINSHLNEVSVEADPNNTRLVQISVARVIRGYLANIVDRVTLFSWQTPAATPEIVREIAGMLIAAQVYINSMSGQTMEMPDEHFAQRLYDRAVLLLNQIVGGEVVIDGVIEVGSEIMSELDFFPRDDTDRAFTMNMEL